MTGGELLKTWDSLAEKNNSFQSFFFCFKSSHQMIARPRRPTTARVWRQTGSEWRQNSFEQSTKKKDQKEALCAWRGGMISKKNKLRIKREDGREKKKENDKPAKRNQRTFFFYLPFGRVPFPLYTTITSERERQ